MKVLLLSAGSSIHTARWANGLSRSGIDVYLGTQHPVSQTFDGAVEIIEFPDRGNPGYFLMGLDLRRIARSIGPDIINAHFASGYGTTGRLLNIHPYVLSVWGSDVFSFPARSPLHRWLIRKNLRAADVIASTSHFMAEQVRRLVPETGNIPITPFGIELETFAPAPPRNKQESVIIGTVKSMETTYGIDTLIQAFAILRDKLTDSGDPLAHRIVLRLVGTGSQIGALQKLANQLELGDQVVFVGAVPYADVPDQIASLDIYVALSRQESFGVAILEAGAVGRPVVVSDAGGLAEIVRHGVTGLVVPKEDPLAAADAILALVQDSERCLAFAESAVQHVRENYAWEHSVAIMIAVYEDAIRSFDRTCGNG